ncbi:MAG: ABC transporter ATP-binding protein, partial [Oscillospiraceae bacterium]|nr:ABC transporter ATP-binding protein [Oscillospiraceae bacterium]
MSALLEIKNLSVSFRTPQGEVEAVRDASFSLHPGEVLAIVGESGCGKSVLCRSIMKLLPKNGWIKSGTILADGADITHYTQRDMERLRGRLFSMVFQDPLTALDPTMTVGAQIAGAVRVHRPGLEKAAVRRRTLELMDLVGIPGGEDRYGRYPHDLSGGMRQRAVMAVALAAGPRILFADEPTTALDVTIQAQILDLLRDIQAKLGAAAVLVTHD